MQGLLTMIGVWLVFGISHVGLAAAPVRNRLVSRLGERGFAWSFVLIASALFALLVVTFARVRGDGPPGLALAARPWLGGALHGASALGIVLMVGALAPSGYLNSPLAILRDGVRPPYGLERITRHPFFSGLVLLMASHALLASRLTGTVFFAGFVVLAVFGPMHQARKIRARKGPAFERYLETTSAVPFVAIACRRQRLVLGEIPWLALGLGALAAVSVRALHERILDWHGAPLILAVVGGSVVLGTVTTRRQRRALPEPGLSHRP
jgi:uncharacterized membrane protein